MLLQLLLLLRRPVPPWCCAAFEANLGVDERGRHSEDRVEKAIKGTTLFADGAHKVKGCVDAKNALDECIFAMEAGQRRAN